MIIKQFLNIQAIFNEYVNVLEKIFNKVSKYCLPFFDYMLCKNKSNLFIQELLYIFNLNNFKFFYPIEKK